MSYHFIEHTADIAVEIEAATMEDLFSISCHAWRDAALESADSSSTEWKSLEFTADNYEELLVQLLSELNFILYARKWVFNSADKLELTKSGDSISLNTEILGEPYDENFHTLKEEIKAVTYHQMKIEKIHDNFTTKIVFDI